ncbi:hypothetical protein BB560_007023 [Smittium megazygosporum]|uniref:AB hydrolase-1 domain-containing protein n=1 Tax=Smittium megazygosporum TaxID=133381 RepID=A0A2T9XZE4_9FUNG|nr:hypothetical protein BB560_007023 [Smittium megazygosporum]
MDPALNPNAQHLHKYGHIKIGDHPKLHCNVFYELYGTGPQKVVFLNGMGTDRQMWELMVKYFAPKEEFQVLVYDYRGTGFSDDCSMFSITTRQMALDTIELFEALGWNENINIVGTSMGGMIATELALKIPERIRTLTLCSTTSGRTVYKKEAVFMNIKMLFSKLPEDQIKLAVRELYPQSWLQGKCIFSDEFETNQDFVVMNSSRRLKNTKIHGFSTFMGQTLAVMRHYVPPESLKKIGELFGPKKIYVVVGTYDNFIPETDSHYIAANIGKEACVLDVFEGSGHSIPVQNYNEFCNKIHALFDQGSVPI